MSRPFAAAALGLWLAGCIAPPPATVPSGTATSSPAASSTSAARHCSWPGGARAAVSLTYDDAMASQLRYALPVLERHGLKATFFLSGKNLAEFSPLTKAGHELGSHTVTHPCNAELASLSLDEMGAELDTSISDVHALGASGKLTFAYPCGQTRLARSESYIPLVKQRYRAASRPRLPNRPALTCSVSRRCSRQPAPTARTYWLSWSALSVAAVGP